MMTHKFDHSVERRLRNFPLAPSQENALMPVYEAVSNGIHAIEDKAPDERSDERVDIYVTRNSDELVASFEIVDSGVGLNEKQFESFKQLDSIKKLVRGGKGVGRLSWLKAFERVSVASTYADTNVVMHRSFDFVLSDSEPFENYTNEVSSGDTGTSVSLTGYRAAYGKHAPKKPDTLLRALTRHFLKEIIRADAIQIIVHDNETTVLNDYLSENLLADGSSNFELEIDGNTYHFNIDHLRIKNTLKDPDTKENTIYLIAHGRVVKTVAINELIGMKSLKSGSFYLGTITSEYFDSNVSTERTVFLNDSSVLDSIVRKAAEEVVEFLHEDRDEVRKRQRAAILKIRQRFPRFSSLLKDPDEYVSNLKLSQTTQEALYTDASIRWYRNRNKIEKSYAEIIGKGKLDSEQQDSLKNLISKIDDEAKSALAEYLAERRHIIDILDTYIGYIKGEAKHEYEEQLHNLICPMGATSDAVPFEGHNLWLLDERLPFYSYFNSDKKIHTQTDADSGTEPDLTFYETALAFQRKSGTAPIAIVEFKRPWRDNYTGNDNPIKQCLNYARSIRKAGKATDFGGKTVSWIKEDTLVYAYVVADLMPSLESVIADYGYLSETPDGRGYWGLHKEKVFVEIIPFDKLVDIAKERHEAFFDRLGLS